MNGIQEVVGSIPISSTNLFNQLRRRAGEDSRPVSLRVACERLAGREQRRAGMGTICDIVGSAELPQRGESRAPSGAGRADLDPSGAMSR